MLQAEAKSGEGRRGLWAWAFFDWANSAWFTLIETFVFAAYFARAVAPDEATGTALWGNMMAASGLLVGVLGPVLGAVADQCGRRKPWIAAFTAPAVVSTALLWFVEPSADWIVTALLLVAVGGVCSEFAVIFYNAMLPGLAEPERLGRWSGWGWAVGYAGGLGCLALALLAFVDKNPWFPLPRESAMHVRASALLTAAWFAVFSLPLFLRTPDEPATGMPLRQAAARGLRQIRDSFRQVRGHKAVWRFLIARMIYNDALATVFAFGGIYAAGTFGLKPEEVLLFGIGLNVTAGLGSLAFAWIDDRVGPRRAILWSVWGVMLPAGLLLLVTSTRLFWTLGLVLGLFVGPVQASSRTWLAHAAPPELRNQMFGLFALSGKLTTFLGPFLVGWITLFTGSQRVGMTAIIGLFALGLWLMRGVPEAREASQG